MAEQTMRAVRIVGRGGGGVEALEVCDADAPVAFGDRVRVRVCAAALNRADLLQRRGSYPAPPGVVADIPGLEFAGEIESMGADARTFKVGQRVFGITAGGAQAEYVVVPESHLAEIPANLSWTEAAAVPEVFITAHDALYTQARLSPGESVLIHAAGSGVGTAAIQLARASGAGAIYGTARTAGKLEKARRFGLDETSVVGDDPQVFADAVRAWTKGRGVNVVLDLVGASYLSANLDALAGGGRMMSVGTLAGTSAPLDFRVVMSKRLSITGTVLRARTTEEKASAVRLFAAHVLPLFARGLLRPVLDSVFPLDEVRAAHTRLESNETFGKVVLSVSAAEAPGGSARES